MLITLNLNSRCNHYLQTNDCFEGYRPTYYHCIKEYGHQGNHKCCFENPKYKISKDSVVTQDF